MLLLNLPTAILKKNMFRQFEMIPLLEMPKVMAPYHGTMGPRHRISLPHVLRDTVEET